MLQIGDLTKEKLPRLKSLADQANAAHAASEQAQRAAANHARDCGIVLLEAKAKVPHGRWQRWVSQNCKFSQRKAQRYIAIARRWDEIEAASKTTRVSDLTIRAAMRILSGASDKKLSDDNRIDLLRCPSCATELQPTSNLWRTCTQCWDCRLYRHRKMKVDAETSAFREVWLNLDRTQKREMLKAMAQELGSSVVQDTERSQLEETTSVQQEVSAS